MVPFADRTPQKTLKFINTDASSIHGNVRVGSVYTSESGEWKLAGFEVLSSVKDDESVIYVSFLFVPLGFLLLMFLWQKRRGGGRLKTDDMLWTDIW